MADFGINWNLAQPVDVGGAFSAGLAHGRAVREDMQTKSALAAYATSPSMETANALIAVNPAIGFKAAQEQRGLAKEAAVRQFLSGGEGGMDTTDGAVTTAPTRHPTYEAMVAAGVDPEMAGKIEDRHIEGIKRSTEFLGQVGLGIEATPPADRPAKWANYVAQAKNLGLEVPPGLETYSPQNLDAVVAAGKQVQSIIDLHAPKYVPIVPGGSLRNINPMAGTVATGASTASGPAAGQVEGGYRFKGGDPADPASWEAAGGAPSQGGATFP